MWIEWNLPLLVGYALCILAAGMTWAAKGLLIDARTNYKQSELMLDQARRILEEAEQVPEHLRGESDE